MTSNITNQIDEVRSEIGNLEARLAAPEHSGLSRAELRKGLKAHISIWHDQAAQRGAADLNLLARGGAADLFLGSAHEYHDPQTATREQAIEFRALLTWTIGKDAMLQRFDTLLAEMPEGLSASVRAEQALDIKRQITAAEVREEELIRQAEAEGLLIDPRLGQRPEAAILIGYGHE